MRKKTLAAVLGISFLILGSILTWKTFYPHHCKICDRPICKALGFKIRTSWGLPMKTCCPRCAVHYIKIHSGSTPGTATDFLTGRPIEAQSAVYVEGSDAILCHQPETVRDEIGGASAYTAYDRCLPSMLAFASRDKAKEFIQKHGGKILLWKDISGKT